MKLRTAIVSVVVSASLIAGVGYGGYYALKGKKPVIEVVPVSNVNVGGYYWGMTDTVYGTVTSQISQRVELNDEYSVTEVYVEEGQEVKEGTPLFAYDMTLEELELELEELSLQTQELTQLRLEKELEKLQKTPASASLESNTGTLTASADAIIDEAQTGSAENPEDASELQSEDVDITIEGIETETDPGLADVENEEQAIKGIIDSYMLGIHELFINLQQTDLSTAQLELIDELLEQLADTCHNTLTDTVTEQETAEDGTVKTTVSYTVKADVAALLDEAELRLLESYNEQLEKCQVRYVNLLIREAEKNYGQDAAAFAACVEQIRTEYDSLSTASQEAADCLERILELEELVQQETEEITEQQTEQDTETATEAESEQNTEAESESESGQETEAENESESESESGQETEAETESESQSEPESETEAETESESEKESESETDAGADVNLSGYINSFLELSGAVLADGAQEQDDYLIRLEDALVFYQEWISQPQDDILEETETEPKMSSYVLKPEVEAYLEGEGKAHLLTELEASYKEICMRFVQAGISSLNPQALVREKLEDAKAAYNALGESWQIELEQRWMEMQESQTGTESEVGSGDTEEDEEGTEPVYSPLTLAQTLQAYEVILMIEELNPELAEELLIPALEKAQAAYLALNDSQKLVVWNSDVLIELLELYGLWERETETEWMDDFGSFDDYGGYYDGYTYTAEELQMLIEEKEQEIKECSLTIREMELAVAKRKRVVDGKVVKSTLDGTVVAIGSVDGSTGDYFVEVTNSTGLYAKGVISELALESVNIGDTISGMSYDTNMSFTAVIKEISEYPDPDGVYMSYGSGNTNAAYYPFYALIDDPEGITEGDVELQLSSSMENPEASIYLENYFIRSGKDGKPYVFIQGEDGKLKKQTVVTGKRMYSYATQIVSGLTVDDRIAFPYGKDVKEGADTEVVDMLQDAYM